jgi:hypothetical protein
MSEGKTPPPATGATARMDRVLAEWPSAKRTALEWDDKAEQVMSYIGSGQQPRTADQVSDEDLLRASLPMSPDEVQSSAAVETGSEASNMSNVSSRERDRASLKDLAKLAASPPSSRAPASGVLFGGPPSPKAEVEAGEAKQENSGMINLAALAAEEEAKTAASAKPPALSAEAMSTMRSAEAVKATPAPVKSDKKAIPWVAVSGIVAAAAVAAGVFFGMQRAQRSEMAAPVAVVAPPAAQPVVVASKPAQTQPAVTPVPPAEQGVDPSTLPAAGQPGQAVAAVPGRTMASGPARASGAPAASATVAPALVAVIPTATAPAPTSSDQNLQSMMQQAAGSSPTATPAAAPTTTTDTPLPAPGSVPLKPSQGAIQGALGAALPGARACLGADDPISHATVTFQSDGSVQSVAVSGGAAGKPAEACIRSALGKARVTPFAQPTFTASTTVRPN